MICPKCKSEYREGFTFCADCNVELVDSENKESGHVVNDNQVFINGKQLVCLICGGINFAIRMSPLSLKGFTFLCTDWINQAAINYICQDCGYIFWFSETVVQFNNRLINTNEEIEIDYETSTPMKDECPICFSKISYNDNECVNCGHKLK